MRRTLVPASVLLVMAISACAPRQLSTGAGQPPAEAFSGVEDPVSFWVRDNAYASARGNGWLARAPVDYQTCIAREIVRRSSPELAASVDTFVEQKTEQNYRAIAELSGELSSTGMVEAITTPCQSMLAGNPEADVPKYDIW